MATAADRNETHEPARSRQVIGAVVDVSFTGELPAIFDARWTTEQQRQAAWSSKSRSTWARAPCAPSRWTRPTA